MELTDLTNFLQPLAISALSRIGESSYVVCMEKRKNRSLHVVDGEAKCYLEFLEEAHLQWGYEYYMWPELTRRMLAAILILRRAKITTGVDVDDNGQISYEPLLFDIEGVA